MGSGCSVPNNKKSDLNAPKQANVLDLQRQVKVMPATGCKWFAPFRKPARRATSAAKADADVTVHVATGTRPTWVERLKEARDAELWDGRPRAERSKWKQYIREAKRVANAPRRENAAVIVGPVLEGDLSDIDKLQLPSNKVIVFLSSTFTDTNAERNQLMKDVFPFLRTLCQVMGLDFGSVDMRWGVREETTREHSTTDICLQQVTRSCKESCGPAFLTILGHKYGYRPLPLRITQTEFDFLLRNLRARSQPISDLTEYYLLDENNIPPIYVLKPRDPDMSKADWWTVSQELQQKLQLAAKALPLAVDRDKYFISVTEQEIREGCFNNDKRTSQVLWVNRILEGVTDKHHQNRHLIDMTDGVIDKIAQEYMHHLKVEKIPKDMRAVAQSVLDFNYREKGKANLAGVREMCDGICKALCERILDSYKASLANVCDPLYNEIVRHSRFLLSRTHIFKGHKALLARLTHQILKRNPGAKSIIALHGTAGTGKTSAIAVLAQNLKMAEMPEACLIVRFIGTTSASGSIYDLLQNICHQITRLYGEDPHSVPDDYEALMEYFAKVLTFSTPSKPLLIVLDSLDQLSDENVGRSLKWLPLRTPLPADTYILVSTNPSECLDLIKAHLRKECIFELPYLSLNAASEALNGLMEVNKRTLTEQQRTLLLKSFELNPFPLYLKMLVDHAITWRSHDVITEDRIAAGAAGMTSLLFERLEGRYGQVLVEHALGYISAAKNGLSVNELEDVLSCDDEALDELFEFWMPPVRHIPPLLWIRLRNDLSDYLMEKGSDGTILYTWYYKQVRQKAVERYLDGVRQASLPFRQKAHQALADYFDGRWAEGKVWAPKTTSRVVQDHTPRLEKRMVASQPLIYAGERGDTQRRLNKRKLRELPHHLLQCGDIGRLEAVACSLEFIEAKFEAGQGYDCLSDLRLATSGKATPLLHAMIKVVSSGLPFLLREPGAIYQLVRQQAEGNPSRELLRQADPTCYRLQYLSEDLEDDVEDPCELSLRGHTSGVRCCHYSPQGAYIASTGEDGSLRIWDARTGAEHVTVMGLPGRVYSKMAELNDGGERPCVWDRKGQTVITGSEVGQLQAWSFTGAQKSTNFSTAAGPAHAAGVTGLSVSPDNALLASSSADGTLKIWSMVTLTEVAAVAPPSASQILACEFGTSGCWLAVVYVVRRNQRAELGARSGLSVYSARDWTLMSARYPDGNRKLLCLSVSPDGGAMLATGSDSNTVELWSGRTAGPEVLPKRHHAYVRCVRFTHSGRYIISCADDFVLMVWNATQRRHLVTVAGHMHRVTHVSVDPKGEGRIVSASRDCTLKVWNYEAILDRRSPEADGIPFVVLRPSHDGKYVMTVQGVNSFARIYDSSHVTGSRPVGRTPKMAHSVTSALWTPDDCGIVMLTAGHSGNFTKHAAERAAVHVTHWTRCHDNVEPRTDTLTVSCPSAIAVNKNRIAVGTCSKTVSLFDLKHLKRCREIIWDKYTLGKDRGDAPSDRSKASSDQSNAGSDRGQVASGRDNSWGDRGHIANDRLNTGSDRRNAAINQGNTNTGRGSTDSDQGQAASDPVNGSDRDNAGSDRSDSASDQSHASDSKCRAGTGVRTRRSGGPSEPAQRIVSVALHPGQDHLAAVCGTKLRVWSFSYRKLLGVSLRTQLTSPDMIHECDFTQDGNHLIYTSQGDVTIVATNTGGNYRRLHVVSGHVDLIHPISVCPDSRHLATASLDGTVRVWQLGGRALLPVAVWYHSTSRRIGFVSSNVLLIGGGTGPFRRLVIEERRQGAPLAPPSPTRPS